MHVWMAKLRESLFCLILIGLIDVTCQKGLSKVEGQIWMTGQQQILLGVPCL